jgi:hypothetical protein
MNLAGQGRLREMELFRRAREVHLLGHGNEISQVAEFHVLSWYPAAIALAIWDLGEFSCGDYGVRCSGFHRRSKSGVDRGVYFSAFLIWSIKRLGSVASARPSVSLLS